MLQPELTALVAEHADADGDDVLSGSFAIDAQDGLSRELVEAMGASWDAFRLDLICPPLPDQLRAGRHPTDDALRSGRPQRPVHGDARVRPRPARVGLGPRAEEGLARRLHVLDPARVPEPIVGERRRPLAAVLALVLPRVQQAFPDQLGDLLERFHRAVNRVQRSLVRVDADETSYGLHVILRFEPEQALASGQLAVKPTSRRRGTRASRSLGLEVPNDRLGVLQDSHWSTGAFGYFPTYLLGSVLSVQIAEKAREAIPELDEQFERGEFSEFHAWLRENLYALGSRFTPRTRSSAWWAGWSTSAVPSLPRRQARRARRGVAATPLARSASRP